MIYGYKDGTILIVGAGDKLSEYQEFYKNIITEGSLGSLIHSGCTQPEFMEMLTDQRFKGFKESPYVFEFFSESMMISFVDLFEIHLCPLYYVVDKQAEMLKPTTKDQYFADKRTLGEIYGLEENDPWDTRSEEQKKEDAEWKDKASKAKKDGNLTGENSFAAPDPELRVRNIRLEKDEDGEIQVRDIMAVKGLFDELPEEEIKETIFRLEIAETIDEICADLNIDFSGELTDNCLVMTNDVLAHRLALYYATQGFTTKFLQDDVEISADFDIAQAVLNSRDKIYYKMALAAPLSIVVPSLSESVLAKIVDRGQIGQCSWLVFNAKTTAVLAEVSLQDIEHEIFPIGVDGERLVPQGINLFEEKDYVEPPRPWNEKAAELATMTEEELAANKKTLSGKEFLFSGSYIDAQVGCIMHVTPKSYFDKHGEMWKNGDLDIQDILPQDIKYVSPGVYQTRSREWMSLYHDMSGRGFSESMAFQLYMNSVL
jgi:hypothetical protein